MRFLGRQTRPTARHLACVSVSGLCAIGIACSSKSPTTPGQNPRSFVGTWSGTIASAAIGQGSLVLSLTSQVETPDTIVVNGHWALTFTDSRFSTGGTVIAAVAPNRILGIIFDRSTVPCPQEAGGAAQQTMFASMTVDGDRMTGTYVAGICPGGTMEMTKK